MNRKTFILASTSLLSFNLLAAKKKKKKNNKKKKPNKKKTDQNKSDYVQLNGQIIFVKEGLNENYYLKLASKQINFSATLKDKVSEFVNQKVSINGKLINDKIISIKEIKIQSAQKSDKSKDKSKNTKKDSNKK